jgi:hypothetical protein
MAPDKTKNLVKHKRRPSQGFTSELFGIFEQFDYALEQTTRPAAVDASVVEA